MNINLRRLAMWLVIVLLLLISFSLFQTQRTRSRDISFSQLLEENGQGHMRNVVNQTPEIHTNLPEGQRPGSQDTSLSQLLTEVDQNKVGDVVIQTSRIHYVSSEGQITTASQDISFSQLLTEVDQNHVRDVVIQGPEIHGTFTNGSSFQTYAPNGPTLVSRLYNGKVQITAKPPGDNVPWFVSLGSWLPFSRWHPGDDRGRGAAELDQDQTQAATAIRGGGTRLGKRTLPRTPRQQQCCGRRESCRLRAVARAG